jgi:5'-3' exonuclease
MDVHLIDGTYELFRHFFAVPSALDRDGREIGAVRGVLGSVLGIIESGATHLGVATDHVIESFRNDLYAGYKTGEGIDPELAAQFDPLEDGLRAMGVRVWAMIEQEADDALAAAAARADADPSVERVWICTPDKDLAQCVRGERVVQLDRRRGEARDASGVRKKFGVAPGSIPDYLALVGDSADGFPGLAGWGAKSSATLLSRYPHLEDIPKDPADWDVRVRNAHALAQTLSRNWAEALLFRDLATLRTNAAVFASVDELEWRGPLDGFKDLCASMRAAELWERALRAYSTRQAE